MIHRHILAIAALAGLSACTTEAPDPTGRQNFVRYCASCHGTDATGNGPNAADWPAVPPDLTGLAARNGGSFPFATVMTKVWGAADGSHRATMPGFSAFFDDDAQVLYDIGDGAPVPTPRRLVELAEYLASIQR